MSVSVGLCVGLSVWVVCSGSVCDSVRPTLSLLFSSYSPRCVHVGAVKCGVAPVVFR